MKQFQLSLILALFASVGKAEFRLDQLDTNTSKPRDTVWHLTHSVSFAPPEDYFATAKKRLALPVPLQAVTDAFERDGLQFLKPWGGLDSDPSEFLRNHPNILSELGAYGIDWLPNMEGNGRANVAPIEVYCLVPRKKEFRLDNSAAAPYRLRFSSFDEVVEFFGGKSHKRNPGLYRLIRPLWTENARFDLSKLTASELYEMGGPEGKLVTKLHITPFGDVVIESERRVSTIYRSIREYNATRSKKYQIDAEVEKALADVYAWRADLGKALRSFSTPIEQR